MWTVPSIPAIDVRAKSDAEARQERLTKPPGSLGRLEKLSIQLAGIQARPFPTAERAHVVVFAGDHGVARRGVSAYPQSVTAQMCVNFCAGNAAVNVLARQAGATLDVVDVGVHDPVAEHPKLISVRLSDGTADFTQQPAMSHDICRQALAVGSELAEKSARGGVAVFIPAEMGIANSTSAAALTAALLQLEADQCCGRGTGIDDAALARKQATVKAGLQRHRSSLNDPFSTLAALGGFEIAAMAGGMLTAAAERMAVVVDGFIAAAAALVAIRMQPDAAPYFIWSQIGPEPGHRRIIEALNAEPILNLDLSIGEGAGAVLCLHFMRAACRTLAEMATFAQAGVTSGMHRVVVR